MRREETKIKYDIILEELYNQVKNGTKVQLTKFFKARQASTNVLTALSRKNYIEVITNEDSEGNKYVSDQNRATLLCVKVNYDLNQIEKISDEVIKIANSYTLKNKKKNKVQHIVPVKHIKNIESSSTGGKLISITAFTDKIIDITVLAQSYGIPKDKTSKFVKCILELLKK